MKLRSIAVTAVLLVVLTGCDPVDVAHQVADVMDAPPAPTYTIDATCDAFNLELTGWPEETILIYGIGADPPYGTSPGNSPNGYRSAPVRVYNLTDGVYGWAVLIDSPDDTQDIDVAGMSTTC
jgi:hypothetical protein